MATPGRKPLPTQMHIINRKSIKDKIRGPNR